MSDERIPATERHAGLVEVAARAVEDHRFKVANPRLGRNRFPTVVDNADWDEIRAALEAVGDALRQEGAAAERVRVVEGLRERLAYDLGLGAGAEYARLEARSRRQHRQATGTHPAHYHGWSADG